MDHLPIYHMVPRPVWEASDPAQPFAADTLETEGFIHCSDTLSVLVEVGNRFYRDDERAYLVLVLDPQKLMHELRWEEADGRLFPHIYGPINRDAITQIASFPRSSAGTFLPLAVDTVSSPYSKQ